MPTVLDPALDAPGVGWAAGPLGEVQAADREVSRYTARRYRAVAAFAATRPATADRAQGERGAMSAERWAARAEVLRPVSEWAARELSLACQVSTQRAEDELERALLLTRRLPRVLDALEAGLLHPGHLWSLLEHLAPVADDALRARLVEDVLAWLAARGRVTTPAQLADRVRRVVARHAARDAARDLVRALARRGVTVRPERTTGMSAVTVVCTTAEARALIGALDAYVDALDPDPADTRTRGQKMVDCLLDPLLRPGEGERPPVQALLTIVASVQTLLGGDAPGEVEGHLVPAEMARHLVRALAGPDLADPDPADPDPAAPDPAAPDPAVADPAAPDPAAPQPAQDTSRAAAPAGRAPAALVLGGDLEPVDTEGGPVDRAAATLSTADFDRWLDDLVRQFSDDDETPGAHDGGPPGPAAVAEPTDAEPLRLAPAGSPPPGGRGWWAAADRAVDHAGDVLLVLERALGHAHRTVRTAETADAADEAAWQQCPAGRVTAAPDALGALAAATGAARHALADLLARTGGGGLADRPRLALTDAVSGTLLALTDLTGLRRVAACGRPACRRHPERCAHDLTGRPGLGPPPPSPGHDPSAALDRYTRARDRRCRFPGCRRPVPTSGELDHVHAWPAGPTSAANLAGLCTTDHRGKHQAPGWTHRLDPDGTLTVTTPSGLTATTTPPPC